MKFDVLQKAISKNPYPNSIKMLVHRCFQFAGFLFTVCRSRSGVVSEQLGKGGFSGRSSAPGIFPAASGRFCWSDGEIFYQILGKSDPALTGAASHKESSPVSCSGAARSASAGFR